MEKGDKLSPYQLMTRSSIYVVNTIQEDVPAMFPLTYQEQMYGDIPNTPNTVMTPHFVEEQVRFFLGWVNF